MSDVGPYAVTSDDCLTRGGRGTPLHGGGAPPPKFLGETKRPSKANSALLNKATNR